MDINFELYKVFYEVATERSISKGASKLMISQPAVTQAIKTLEGQLNGQLFIRTPKGVILTTEGEELYKYIKEGMNYFINGKNRFTSLKNLEFGVINIGTTTTIAENFLIPYLDEFHKKYPNVDINIYNDLTENLVKDLRNGKLDIIIMAIPKNNINDLKVTFITELTDIFVGNNKYKGKKYKTAEELFNEEILIQKPPSITRTNFNNYLKANNLVCNPKMEVVSHGLLTKLAENGFGIALLTKEYIKDKINKSLFEVETPLNIPKRKLGYATKINSVPSFATEKFIKLLKEKI